MTLLQKLSAVALSGVALAFGSVSGASAQALEKLTIVIFAPPSLGALLPPVIKAQKFDEKNGLDIKFEERTPDAYATQFNSGEFKIGGSASLTTLGLADVRGVKVKYLFNLFDFWGAIVTSRDNVKTLKDIEGKELAGARSTTNYQMAEFFLKPVSSIIGPNGTVVLPKVSKHVDFECELCAVIGKTARKVTEEKAHDYIFGYLMCWDLSQRDPWGKGVQNTRNIRKGFDTFTGLGTSASSSTSATVSAAPLVTFCTRIDGSVGSPRRSEATSIHHSSPFLASNS